MLEETLDVLRPAAGAALLDGTVGLGGHSAGWLERTRDAGGTGRVIGLDRDAAALEHARARLDNVAEGRATLVHASYETARETLDGAGTADVDAALLDLGASSLQLDDAARGFSFRSPGPLDMRMDAGDEGPTAADVVNHGSEDELAAIFSEHGEEPRARAVARAVCTERRRAPFRDTLRLAECVARAVGGRRGRLHPATRVFQALRIEVNRELERVERGLPAVASCVRSGGVLAVLTFHRLEDRLVKTFFKDRQRFRDLGDAVPSASEQRRNPRSRSARLRAVEVTE